MVLHKISNCSPSDSSIICPSLAGHGENEAVGIVVETVEDTVYGRELLLAEGPSGKPELIGTVEDGVPMNPVEPGIVLLRRGVGTTVTVNVE